MVGSGEVDCDPGCPDGRQFGCPDRPVVPVVLSSGFQGKSRLDGHRDANPAQHPETRVAFPHIVHQGGDAEFPVVWCRGVHECSGVQRMTLVSSILLDE
jgi:hypothetical protein